MARVKKDLEQQLDVAETGLVYTQPEEVVVVDKNPLHTKYAKFIEQAKDGYLTGFDYPSAMEILRYCEAKRGVQMGLNMNCSTCLLQLIKMFDNLRD